MRNPPSVTYITEEVPLFSTNDEDDGELTSNSVDPLGSHRTSLSKDNDTESTYDTVNMYPMNHDDSIIPSSIVLDKSFKDEKTLNNNTNNFLCKQELVLTTSDYHSESNNNGNVTTKRVRCDSYKCFRSFKGPISLEFFVFVLIQDDIF